MFVAVNVLCIRLSDAYILMMTRVKCLTAAYMTRHPPPPPPPPRGRASSEDQRSCKAVLQHCLSHLLPSCDHMETLLHDWERRERWEGKGSGAWRKGEVWSKGHVYGGKHWRVGVYTITNWNGVEWMSAGKQCIPIICHHPGFMVKLNTGQGVSCIQEQYKTIYVYNMLYTCDSVWLLHCAVIYILQHNSALQSIRDGRIYVNWHRCTNPTCTI